MSKPRFEPPTSCTTGGGALYQRAIQTAYTSDYSDPLHDQNIISWTKDFKLQEKLKTFLLPVLMGNFSCLDPDSESGSTNPNDLDTWYMEEMEQAPLHSSEVWQVRADMFVLNSELELHKIMTDLCGKKQKFGCKKQEFTCKFCRWYKEPLRCRFRLLIQLNFNKILEYQDQLSGPTRI